MKLYFAYGANLNRASMALRCPRARPLQALYMPDWHLEFATHANIRPEPGSVVPGALWEITPECEASLDRFEGFPIYYQKQTIMVQDREVMFYVMPEVLPAMPSVGYLTTIAEGYADWDLDHEYLWTAVRECEDAEAWQSQYQPMAHPEDHKAEWPVY